MTAWPLQKDCDAFYGNPRGTKDRSRANATWESANLVTVPVPFRMFFAGHPVSTIRIHRKCADSLARVLDRIWIAAGKDQKVVDGWGASTYGGSYSYRLMRGLNTLSMHSYGCAIDLDPARNALHDRTPTFTPASPVVQAFLAEGWVWGGDWDGDHSSADEPRCDGMHFQAARLK